MSYPFRAAVLDTSVAVKWFVPEEGSERATSLRRAHLEGEIQLYVPDLLLMELANALRYTSLLSEERILDGLATFSALDISIVPFSIEALRASIALSLEQDLAVYDAYFLAVAQELGLPFITADRKMLSRFTSEDGAVALGSI
ncbi:putative nucleic acid-binding protein contains PIN domain (plasmid) [Rubrobacter radiotolerans]|uniref:Ribonuclease VapC n=1 Tax=Rubrobacter radiotolerans TaxID=42256 RepID=A0A023X7Q6_RUBRA|nr:type II toxin-antitoxin system VapC family toxin [Rubrobacter radiotolerans]AHY48060.1 putative nucleic acid-binding protein contains PIN domain [Rubrobacter radiotolerans]MDX5895336.1 type II toxin-antitoxin system VapC family toxin [Rubrobacter radiotolerans]SMC01660.1 Predicted nucleic acid-binding protein, contains PIN domain [Rubrobacter radiotolerans DSM 5868]